MTGMYMALQIQPPRAEMKDGLLTHSALTNTQRGPAQQLRHIKASSLCITIGAL